MTQTSVFTFPPGENWIVDRIVEEWQEHHGTPTLEDSDVVWLAAGWCYRRIHPSILHKKKVVTTIHHVVPEKFGEAARKEFTEQDSFTDAFHVPNVHTRDFIRPLTKKDIHVIPYWANPSIWRRTGAPIDLRKKHGLPESAYLIGSFQRDTEGSDLRTPKLEKGPDLLVDFIKHVHHARSRSHDILSQVHVVLAGWRRQYVIRMLESLKIPYTYFELPPQDVINELYQTLDLYPVTSRYEGGPQSLIECGLLGISCVSRSMGMAEEVLSSESIHEDVSMAVPDVPRVDHLVIPERGFDAYRRMFDEVVSR